MKKTILIIALGWILGIIGGLYNHIVPFIFLGIILLIVILKILNIKYSSHFLKLINLWIKNNVLLIFLTAAFIASLHFIIQNNQYEAVYHQFSSTEIIATVVSNKRETEYQEVYTIKLEEYNHIQLVLRVAKSKKINLKYGDKIKINGQYQVPESARNYGGFDYKEYLKTQKVYGIFEAEKIERLKENNLSYIALLSNRVKQKIITNINKILPNETKELFLGILIGYDDYLQEEIQESFRKSSLSHLLAVSGAHITYIMIGFTYLLSKLKIPKKVRNIFIIAFLYFFMYLTSFSASVVRASIMGIMGLFSLLVCRRYDIKTAMSVSLLLTLIDNPYKILDLGLLLSYFATIGILVFVYIRKEEKKDSKESILIRAKDYLKDLVLITIFANIFVMPIILYSFNTISFSFILSNLIASILIGPITIGGFLLIIFSFIHIKLAYVIAIPYNLLLQILIHSTKLVSQMPYSEILLPTPSLFIICIYYFLLFLFLFYKLLKKSFYHHYMVKKIVGYVKNTLFFLRKKRYIILFFTIFIFSIFLFFKTIPKDLKIYFIDVGQGDSTLIITPTNKKILIDSGGQETGNFDVGKSTLVPYLLDRGMISLDYICISHFDSDHCQGFIYLLNNIHVKNIILSKQPESSSNFEEILSIAKSKKINIIVVKKDDKIYLEKEVSMQVLWPDTNHFIAENVLNNNSMVCKFCYKNFSILFTGDIEEIAEKQILQTYQNTNLLKATILKVAHHRFKNI